MRTHEEGFGLVEIMVGLGIGMLAMIVVLQVYSQAEAQKRSTTSGADAQTNGAVALYMLERDARNAGWGMSSSLFSGCATTYTYCDGSAACGGTAGPISSFSLTPVTITEGGDQPDSLTIRYFADTNLGTFRLPTNTVIRDNMPMPSAELDVASTEGCREGNLVLVAQAGRCTLMQVTQVQGQALKIQHNPGGSGIYNPSTNYENANNWPAYTIGATLSCFAAAPNGPQFLRSYAIDSTRRQLLRTDNAPDSRATNEVVSPEIVDMQAQYGVAAVATPPSQVVAQWVTASGTTWANPSVTDRNRIKAIRVAVVARSAQYEKPAPNTECATTTPDMVATWSSWATFSTASYPSDWKCYRYKVFETVVPLRNVMWGNI